MSIVDRAIVWVITAICRMMAQPLPAPADADDLKASRRCLVGCQRSIGFIEARLAETRAMSDVNMVLTSFGVRPADRRWYMLNYHWRTLGLRYQAIRVAVLKAKVNRNLHQLQMMAAA